MLHRQTLALSGLIIGLSINTIHAESSCPPAKTYTTNADFDLGTMLRVNHETPGRLKLNPAPSLYPYINIACLGRGTVVRLFVGTADDDPDHNPPIPETTPPYIVGEYWTGPATGGARTPSRTAVDHRGNLWVGARQNNAVTRIALLIGGTVVRTDEHAQYLQGPFDYCSLGPGEAWRLLDRHGTTINDGPDGLIKTSRGLGHILAWHNASPSPDADGGVKTAEDELIITYVRTQVTDVRSVAIDFENNLWAGGYADYQQERISGDTSVWVNDNLGGASMGEPVPATCGGYGALVDHGGVLWSARYTSSLLRYDPLLYGAGSCLSDMGQDSSYSVGLDPVTGHIWTSRWGTNTCELDHRTGEMLHCYQQPWAAKGIAVDCRSHIWVASGESTQVMHLAPVDGNSANGHYEVGIISGLTKTTGVAIDLHGRVWIAQRSEPGLVARINPDRGAIGPNGVDHVGLVDRTLGLGSGADPYDYTDMAGMVSHQSALHGEWTVTHDGTIAGAQWGTVSWNQLGEQDCPADPEPGYTSLRTLVRAADTEVDLEDLPWRQIENNVRFYGVTGRYIQIKVVFAGRMTCDGHLAHHLVPS